MDSIVHFEIPVDDIERAKSFYQNLFGWEITPFPMPTGEVYYGVRTTQVDSTQQPMKPGAINGGMMARKDKGQPFMNYIHVTNITEKLAAIEAAGGTVCLPKTEIAPGMGWIAAFRDPERNMMGLHELPVSSSAAS